MASSLTPSAQQPNNNQGQEQDQQQQQQQLSRLDQAILLAIHTWPAMSLAVSSNWGGPTSSDKRDWLCGAISDILQDRPETDAEDLEDILIQVMNDEFDVVVDDESAGGVAVMIMRFKEQVRIGEFGELDELWTDWEEKRKRKGGGGAGNMFKKVEGDDKEQETSDEDEEDDDGDVEMDEAPELVSTSAAPRERVEPEVDDEGFTKVVGKKKR